MADKPKTPSKKQEPQVTPERRLLRTPDDKVFAGVAGGLGRYFKIDPTLVRLGFAAAAIFGGFGILAYLVMAVVVPEDDGSGRPVAQHRPPRWALILLVLAVLFVLPGPFFGWHHGWWFGFAVPIWLALIAGAILLAYRLITGRPLGLRRSVADRRDAEPKSDTKAATAAAKAPTAEAKTEEIRDPATPRVLRALAIICLIGAALAACLALAIGAAWLTATGNGEAVASVVIALGIAIAATAVFADAKRFAAPLLAAALVLGLPAGAVAAADIEFDGGIGQRTYTPTATTDLPSDGYQLGIGQLVVDLRDLPWKDGETVPLETDLGIGQMVVSVPSNVCVHAHATGKAGDLIVRGDTSEGVDPEISQGEPRGNAPRLELDAQIQIGQLVVTDKDPDDVDHEGPGPRGRDHDADLGNESQKQACGI